MEKIPSAPMPIYARASDYWAQMHSKCELFVKWLNFHANVWGGDGVENRALFLFNLHKVKRRCRMGQFVVPERDLAGRC